MLWNLKIWNVWSFSGSFFHFKKIWAKQDTMKAPRVGREARDLPAILLRKNSIHQSIDQSINLSIHRNEWQEWKVEGFVQCIGMARAYILRFKVILMSIVSRYPEHMDQQQAHASRSPGLTRIWHGERGKAGESSTSQEEALTVPKTQRVSVILPTYVTGFRTARNISESENSKFSPNPAFQLCLC